MNRADKMVPMILDFLWWKESINSEEEEELEEKGGQFHQHFM